MWKMVKVIEAGLLRPVGCKGQGRDIIKYSNLGGDVDGILSCLGVGTFLMRAVPPPGAAALGRDACCHFEETAQRSPNENHKGSAVYGPTTLI